MYKFQLGDITFPITPGSVSITSKSNNETVELINTGEVTFLKTPGLREVSFKVILPRVAYPFSINKKAVPESPESIIKKLRIYQKERQVVPFRIKRKLEKKTSKKIKLKKTEFRVTIEELNQEENAENGFDVVLNIKLKEYRDFSCKKLVIKKRGKKSGKATGKKGKKRQHKKIPDSYVVQKGDCLYNIAKKQLNDASRWKEIYTLNKKNIEATAKQHKRKSSSNGHYIYPGTKLKLPS